MYRLWQILRRGDYIIVFVLLVVAAVVMMTQSTYYQGSRIVVWANGVAGGWYQGVGSIGGYFGLKAENDRLAAENAALKARMEESYISYTDSVFTVADTTYRQRYTYQEARVIKNSWTQQNNYLMINKGSRHGVEPDMAIISPSGIVGVVVAVSSNFSTVMPVLHSDSRNSVKVKRTGVSGSLVWDGKNYQYAQIEDITTAYAINEGDTIVASGQANDFPEGVLAGYVVSAEADQGSGFYRVTIRLATDFNKLDHVYVVNNHFHNEQQQLLAKTGGSE
ncbi:MAG: rod shape-determining protein MreC [Bacteroidales bacterium]|nr:rod shape-determining protein MreC [Bacteroidales bacterium]